MSNETQINPNLVQSTNKTSNAKTEINPKLMQQTTILKTGDVLADKYSILEHFNQKTGEADLYLCQANGMQYVAKIYRREIAIKPEVVEILKATDTPFVAKLYEVGEYQGKPFEILPFYKNGSLQGRTFTLGELKSAIIPSINEGLRALHQKKMFHKDIKPSNLMMLNDETGVAMIDFGISSVTEDGSTVLLTKTGMTPEYSAPEAIVNLISEESDYYSFGITLFELFHGSTPYQNMSAEEIARFTALQKFPFPDTMLTELKQLIQGLTYNDITNRQDKSNPNRRWTYEEVSRWLKGEEMIPPGEGRGTVNAFPPYKFMEKEYETVDELVKALACSWENGKKELYRGLLSGFFKNYNTELARLCFDAEEESTQTEEDEDIVFWKLLYKLHPGTTVFYWKTMSFESLPVLGRDMLEKLWSDDSTGREIWNEILTYSLISKYLVLKNAKKEQIEAAQSLEIYQRQNIQQERDATFNYFCTGYFLSGHTIFSVKEENFQNPVELSAYMKSLFQRSFDELREFCHSMIQYNNTLDPQLEAWLVSLGKRSELERWRGTLML